MDALKPLVAERGSVKAKLTVFRKFVESSDVSSDIVAFEKRVRANERLYEKFDLIQSQIETAVVSTHNEEAQLAERELFEDTYFKIMSKAESRLVHARGEAGPSMFIANSVTPVPSDPHPATRLPVIKLPSFDGNLTEWIRFRDTFRSVVHDSEKLTDIDRFNYLVSALTGSAARTIESFSVSASNYRLAWSRLKERFDDPKALIAHHINVLLDTQPIKKQSGKALGELADTAVNNVSALESLLKPEEILDAFVSTCVIRKLDSVSCDEWDKRTMDSPKMPPFKDLAKFLEQRSQYLLRRDTTQSSPLSNSFERPKISKPREIRKEGYVAASHVTGKTTRCLLCENEHALQYCPKWLAMPFSERHAAVMRSGACFNCLSRGHSIKVCTRGNCRKCGKRHHTLLHRENVSNDDKVDSSTSSSTSIVPQSCIANSTNIVTDCAVLSTALVFVTDQHGKVHKCRALLDVGSQANFVTREFCDRVALPRQAVNTVISGVGRVKSKISSIAQLRIASGSDNFRTGLPCLVIDNITDEMPNVPLERVKIPIPSGLIPADPEFQRPGRVDLLIGCGLFWDLLCIGQIKIGVGNLMWQKTRLGWVLGGRTHWPTASANAKLVRACHAITNTQLDESVARFWEIDEFRNIEALEGTDPCEQHFRKHTTRDEQGRFVVGIPFNDRILELGESRAQAERRLLNMDRKCRKNPDFGKQYIDFLREYVELGHMTKLTAKEISSFEGSFYLPHHAVMRENSTTTKLRVVFDGSAKTSTGVSLNDAQIVGRPVQDDLISILVRFRKHRIVLSADIAKMYRQVAVRKEDRKYQLILWRCSDRDSIDTYSLNTVTYGTAAASYLATRALRQVGKDCSFSHPSVSETILKDFYVDDLLTGCETVEQAVDLRESLTRVLAQAGFPLRKWASNEPRAIVHDNDDTSFEFKTIDREAKTLGLLWSVSTDELTYSSQYKEYSKVTKRYILAEIAQIFDPLGLIGPLIVKAKLFMQRLWALRIGWDESLPQDLHSQWLSFRNEMSEISSVRIPRRVLLSYLDIEVHGFSDASERAYGAAVYLRSRTDNKSWVVQLLCAKSRVAPLKTLSLPRLELCGAVLLAQLLAKVRDSLQINHMREYYWTDSQVVLAWIKDRPCRWKTFVANRTAEIQTQTLASNWFHIKSADNPADLLSRGATLSVLRNSSLWWHGPGWLTTDYVEWPHPELSTIEVPEERSNSIVQLAASVDYESLIIDLATRYSCYDKFIRIVAYIFRFYSNVRDKQASMTTGQRELRPLSVVELASAERVILRAIQGHFFSKEMHKLKSGLVLDKNSSLLSLHPFLDEHGIIRVGGRLQNAPITVAQKHPVIIPNSSPLAVLLVRREHLRLLHAGCQQTLASLHSRYWLVSGRRVTRKVLRNCMRCFRSNPGSLQPPMGTLPAARVTPARAFANCGVDYAGPFLLIERGRARTVRKAYICLFVCMVTKAIHIELAVDLTTDAFLNCLHRFMSRRGKCLSIYSDNGTNFVGARNELKELGILLASRSHNNKVAEALAQEGIEWHLIPPRAPHFGGLWERGVRSVKAHMKRVIGEQKLTFEELYTILTRIEACLNSRPLHPLSPDPSDLLPLTPGHFLVGEALTALPQADLGHLAPNRLNRFQLLQQMLQHFWKRWQRDYLHALQQRQKWRLGSPDVPTVGALVLIKEDNLSPMKWALGRILEVHPGQDNVVRVVTIRIATGTLKRPTIKICLLPSAEGT